MFSSWFLSNWIEIYVNDVMEFFKNNLKMWVNLTLYELKKQEGKLIDMTSLEYLSTPKVYQSIWRNFQLNFSRCITKKLYAACAEWTHDSIYQWRSRKKKKTNILFINKNNFYECKFKTFHTFSKFAIVCRITPMYSKWMRLWWEQYNRICCCRKT